MRKLLLSAAEYIDMITAQYTTVLCVNLRVYKLMNSIVIDAIKTLLEEGKTPTVALTKNKLSQPVPMPIIIAAVSQYKNNPESIHSLIQQPSKEQTSKSKESQLDRIEAKLDKLLALIDKN